MRRGRPTESQRNRRGHFDNLGLPTEERQFAKFFTNATEWITERSKKIAEALGTKVKRGSDVGEGI